MKKVSYKATGTKKRPKAKKSNIKDKVVKKKY